MVGGLGFALARALVPTQCAAVMGSNTADIETGVILCAASLEQWADADDEDRQEWLDSGEGESAGLFSIGHLMGISFVRDEGSPAESFLVYEDGSRVAVVIVGDDEASIRKAVEHPVRVDELTDEFEVEGSLLLFDGENDVDTEGSVVERLGEDEFDELPLEPATYRVEIRAAGRKSGDATVLLFSELDADPNVPGEDDDLDGELGGEDDEELEGEFADDDDELDDDEEEEQDGDD